MAAFFEDHEKLDREDAQHTRRGSCLALVVLLIFVPPLCWLVLTFTRSGQSAKAYGSLYYAYNGIPGITILAGLPELARQSCALDRTQATGNRTTQDELRTLYEAKSKLYREQWEVLTKLEQDTSWFDAPQDVPADLNGGKIKFCR